MPRCAQCSHEFAASSGFSCPACGRDWRSSGDAGTGRRASGSSAAGEAAAEDPSGPRPAHLAILEAAGISAEDNPRAARRLVSSAGPAVPVIKQQTDSVPQGWMAKLDAARGLSSGPANSPPPVPPPIQSSGPPPLKKKADPPARPAHLLLSQLEADEEKKRDPKQKPLALTATGDLAAVSEIAAMSVDLPVEEKRRHIPDWIVKLALFLAVAGGLSAAAYFVLREPPPKAVIDESLKAEAIRIKNRTEALNDAGTFANEGKWDEAIIAYGKVLVIDPKEARAERGLGVAFSAKGDKDKAVVHLKRYLELAPTADDADEVRNNVAAYEKANAPSDKATEPAPDPGKKPKRGRRR